MAGLWERGQGGDGEAVESFTVAVTVTHAAIARIHNRMPAILAPAD